MWYFFLDRVIGVWTPNLEHQKRTLYPHHPTPPDKYNPKRLELNPVRGSLKSWPSSVNRKKWVIRRYPLALSWVEATNSCRTWLMLCHLMWVYQPYPLSCYSEMSSKNQYLGHAVLDAFSNYVEVWLDEPFDDLTVAGFLLVQLTRRCVRRDLKKQQKQITHKRIGSLKVPEAVENK